MLQPPRPGSVDGAMKPMPANLSAVPWPPHLKLQLETLQQELKNGETDYVDVVIVGILCFTSADQWQLVIGLFIHVYILTSVWGKFVMYLK